MAGEDKVTDRTEGTLDLLLEPEHTSLAESSMPQLKKTSASHLLLFFMACLGVGCVFSYDFPQLFEDQLIEKFNVDTVDISLLYSFYSIPNIFLSSPISIAVDRLGFGWSGIILGFLGVVGAILQYLGCQYNSFNLLLAARVMFGISGENLIILVQPGIAEKWFLGKYLTISIGIANMITSFSQFAASYYQPLIYEKTKSIETVAMSMLVLSVIT